MAVKLVRERIHKKHLTRIGMVVTMPPRQFLPSLVSDVPPLSQRRE